jgi:hypothetical protein
VIQRANAFGHSPAMVPTEDPLIFPVSMVHLSRWDVEALAAL